MTTATEPSQHMQALARANRLRTACAALKREVYRGDLTIAEAMEDRERLIKNLTIEELLASQRRWGGGRARKFLVLLAIKPGRPVLLLTKRQRDLIAARLP